MLCPPHGMSRMGGHHVHMSTPPPPAFAVLEIQLMASGVLDKCSPMKPHPQPFLVTFFVCMDAGCMPVCKVRLLTCTDTETGR